MLVPNNILAGNRLGLQLQAIRRMRQAEQGAFSRAYLKLGERIVHLILSAGQGFNRAGRAGHILVKRVVGQMLTFKRCFP